MPRTGARRWTVSGLTAIVVLAGIALGWGPPGAAAQSRVPTAQGAPAQVAGVVVAVLPTDPATALEPAGEGDPDLGDRTLRALDAQGLSLALMSTAQGRYDRSQALLDLSQGTRQPRAVYRSDPPVLGLEERGGRWSFAGWSQVVRRAREASATIEPGLLGASIPGGASFAGHDGSGPDGAVATIAADRSGSVREVSFGPATTLAQRTGALRTRHRLVVVDLPPGDEGVAVLATLRERLSPDDLMLAVHLPPTPLRGAVGNNVPTRFYSQTVLAMTGPASRAVTSPRALVSGSTRQPGLVTAIDVAPTVLDHLGIDVPPRMRGQVIEGAGPVDARGLEGARRRWNDVRSGRQAASLQAIALAAAVVFLVLGTVGDARSAIARSLRVFGLGLLWWPATALVVGVATIASGALEAWSIAGLSVGLALATDGLLRWPAGPAAPAAAGLLLLAGDLAFGGGLLARSVLAPSIVSGNRFYGISNEIEPVLPILLLAGLAACGAGPVRRRRVLYGGTGAALAAVVGAGSLGADVGGVVTVSAAMTAAAVALHPGRPRARAVVLGLAAPVVALAALVTADLAIGRRGHLLDNLTRATGPRELWELVARRYELAFGILLDPGNAVALVLSGLLVAWALRNRNLLYSRLPDAGWRAALVGGLAGGVAGALSNDSGPVLLVNAVIGLAAVTAYVASPPSEPVPAAADNGAKLPEDTRIA